MTRWFLAGKPTVKNIMQKTGIKPWPGKHCIVQKTLRFSNHVVKAGIETIGKGLPAAREPIVNIRNYRRPYSKNNRKRIIEYWRCYYAKNKERIRQILRDRSQRKTDQNIMRLTA